MVTTPDFVREMKRGEEDAVHALLCAAFPNDAEARLVRKLRKQGDIAGESVLPLGDGIIGYYALSKMAAPKGWLCLAPVAVHPDWQGKGHGRRMIGLLGEWARISRQYVIVLGQVPFYERAGFSHARAAGLSTPYGVEHTLVAGGKGADVPEAELVYPAAFGGV